MRKLLNTLFVTTEDSYLALENENLVVYGDEGRKGQFPLAILEGIVSFSHKGASLAPRGASGLKYASVGGNVVGNAVSPLAGRVD